MLLAFDPSTEPPATRRAKPSCPPGSPAPGTAEGITFQPKPPRASRTRSWKPLGRRHDLGDRARRGPGESAPPLPSWPRVGSRAARASSPPFPGFPDEGARMRGWPHFSVSPTNCGWNSATAPSPRLPWTEARPTRRPSAFGTGPALSRSGRQADRRLVSNHAEAPGRWAARCLGGLAFLRSIHGHQHRNSH